MDIAPRWNGQAGCAFEPTFTLVVLTFFLPFACSFFNWFSGKPNAYACGLHPAHGPWHLQAQQPQPSLRLYRHRNVLGYA